MAILNKGHDFSDGDQVTAAKLDSAVDSATFAAGSVDNASTQLSGGAIIVKDSGVTAAKISSGAVTAVKLASNAVTTDKIADANVTKAKIENVADYKVLGNVSGGATAPAEVSILKSTDGASDSETALTTEKRSNAYADAIDSARDFTPTAFTTEETVVFPNGLIMKMGTVTSAATTGTVTFDVGETAFTAIKSIVITIFGASERNWTITASSATAFSYAVNGALDGIYWQAIGY